MPPETPARAARALLVVCVAACAAIFVAGCTSQGVEGRGAPIASDTGGVAVVRIERTTSSVAGETNVDAVFARYQGIGADEVLELLGWPSRDDALVGCRWDATSDVDLPPHAAVDLLDVGPLALDLAGEVLTVEGRLFPSVSSLVAGTIYADSVSLPFRDGEGLEYRVSADGLGDVGQLEGVLPAPDAPSSVTWDSRPLEPGMTLDRDAHVGVQWDAGDPHDRVEIGLRAGGRHLRCGASDDGSFQIRVEALAAMPADPAAMLTVARVRREPLDVTGIDEAWARIVARRAVPVVLR
jgi:hypothetical protein